MLLMYQPGRTGARRPMRSAEQYPAWAEYDRSRQGGRRSSSPTTASHRPESATTVRVRGGDTQITDGPFAETKEYLAGYYLIEAADLDAALGWAAKIPSSAFGSVEVRPDVGGVR